MNKVNLTASVNVQPTEKRAKFVTHVLIKTGDLIVASGKLGGKYTPAQAVAEFAKSPGRFTLAPRFASLTPAAIKALAA
jgi:hypothetical protein